MRRFWKCVVCERQLLPRDVIIASRGLSCRVCAYPEMEALERLALAEWRTDHSEECCCLSCCQKRTAA